jgi:hypothetical protein
MRRADYHFTTALSPRLPANDLEAAALDFHRAGLSYDRFHKRYWKQICKAAGGRRRPGPDLGQLVEKLIAIIKTGEIPEIATAGATPETENAENTAAEAVKF